MNVVRCKTSPLSWLRGLFAPRRRLRACRLGLEVLEDRTVPAQVDLGPLRLVGDTLLPFDGTSWLATGGTVSIGYAPTEGESFLALVNVNLTQPNGVTGTLSLDTAEAPPKFSVQHAAINSVVQGSATPIWQTAGDTAVELNVAQLVSVNGQALDAGQPFTARSVNVSLTNLRFANPDGGSTADAQVLMQGTVSFPQLQTVLADLRNFQARIDGGNYLIADTDGLTLTGLTFAATTPESYTVFGLDLMMAPGTITYSDAGGEDTFDFSAGVTVSTQPQDASGERAVEGLGARLDLTVTTHSVQRFGFDVVGGFKVFGLDVATDADNPLTFDFNFQNQRYEIGGGLSLTVPTATASTVDVSLGYVNNPNDPGVLIVGGELTQLNAYVNGTIHLAAAQITTLNGLVFSYDRDQEQFEMYGDLTLLVPTAGGRTTSLTALMGDENNPGLVIQDNELQQLNLSLSGQFDVFGLTLIVSDAGLMYDRSQDLYAISGTVSVGSLWNATVQLGVGSQPGIVIQDGKFKLDDLTVRVANVNLAVFTLQNLEVRYTANALLLGDYTLDVKGEVILPGGWAVGGELKLVEGKVDAIDLFFLATEGDGIAVADTGLYLTYIEASVQNIDSPHNIVVSGKIGFNYGSTVQILGRGATIFRAEGDFTIDRNELILDAHVYVGAYQTGTDPNGVPTYGGLLGDDSGTLTLDWGDKYYALEVSITLYGVFDVTGLIAFDDGGDFLLAARADVKIPDAVPFVGGMELGNVDFLFEYHHDDIDRSFLAAWTEFTIPIIDKHIEVGFQYDLGGSFSLIGGSRIDAYDGCFNHPEQCLNDNRTFTYYSAFSSPAGAAGVTLTAAWPEAAGTQTVALTLPDGTVVPQSAFNLATNGAAVVLQLSSAMQTGVHVVGSATDLDIPLPQGSYTLTLTSTEQFDINAVKFTAVFDYPAPTIGTPGLSSGASPGTVPVALAGTVDEGFQSSTRVTLYADNDGTGYDGVPVRGATTLPVTTDGAGNWTVPAGWNLSGLLPTDYFVYAVVNDGANTPVFSPYSAPHLANPPMFGTVIDAGDGRHDALPGLLVYLDVNHNGQYDSGEPESITNSEGFFEFWGVQANTAYDVAVVIPTGFEAGSPNPQVVTWDGQDPAVVPIQLLKRAAINGTVYDDFNQNGMPDPGEGLANWVVFGDANGNGQLDSGEVVANTLGDGSYSLLNLTPSTTYAVTLQLQTGYYQTTPVGGYSIPLSGDAYQQIKQQNFGVLPFSTIGGNVAEYALQNGSLGASTTPLEDWTVRLLAPTTAINAGGGADGPYQGDRGFTGGQTFFNSSTIDTRGVVGPAPESVYQTFRFDPATFSYTVPGLTPGATYVARLHFVEHFYTSPGQRIMDVTANGQVVLSGFDIFAASGARDRAVAETVTVPADAGGAITFQFTGRGNEALVNAIEVFSQAAVTTTDANGNYTFSGLRAGEYTVLQEVQDSWRQVTPFNPELKLQTPTGNDYQVNFATPSAAVTAKFTGRTAGIALIDTGVYVFTDANIAGTGQYFQPTDDANALALATGDYFGMGWQDVAVLWQDGGAIRVDVLQNDGSGSLSQQTGVWTILGTAVDFVTARLLNGGGDQLAVLYRKPQSLEVAIATLYLDGSGTPQVIDTPLPQAGSAVALVAGDVEGDGMDELLIGFSNQSPLLVSPLADNSSGFQRLSSLPPGFQVVLGDVNGDGLLDAGVFDGGSLFHYAIQDQAGNFDTAYASGVGKPGRPIGAAMLHDVDGDLRADLVWVSEGVGAQAVFVAQNTLQAGAWFTPARQTVWSLAAAPGGAVDAAAGDFDGDGLPDLVVTDAAGGNVEIVRNRSVIAPTALVVSVVGSNSTDNDFVNAPPGAIYGRVFEDVTRDGNHLPSKPGRAGVTVYVDLDRDGTNDAGEPQTVTGPHGLFAFDGLPDGSYAVRVVPEDGRRLTSPADGSVEVRVRAGRPSGFDAFFATAAELLLPVTDQAVTAGQILTVRLGAAASRRAVFSLEPSAPAGAAIDPRTGRFTWLSPASLAPGNYPVPVRVRDPFEPTQTKTVTFTVTVRPAPVIPLPAPPPALPATVPTLELVVRNGAGLTLVFADQVVLARGALRLFVMRHGRPVRDLTGRLRFRRVVRDGRTVVIVWWRWAAQDGAALAAGRLALWLRNDRVRDAWAGQPLPGPERWTILFT